MTVTIEFFGIPRLRAERATLDVEAGTVREVLRRVEAVCSQLHLFTDAGELVPHYRLSLGGQRFLTDWEEQLPSGAKVLLLSADVGG